MSLHSHQHRREDQQHQNVHRQNVEKGRLELQQQSLDYRNVRLVQKNGDAHLLVVHRVLERGRGIGDLGDKREKRENGGDEDLPSPPQYLGDRVKRAVSGHPAAVDQGGGEAGDEDEHLGRVVKPDRLQGKIAQHVFRDVIDKDQDQRQAAKKIEAEVALNGRLGQGRYKLRNGLGKTCLRRV